MGGFFLFLVVRCGLLPYMVWPGALIVDVRSYNFVWFGCFLPLTRLSQSMQLDILIKIFELSWMYYCYEFRHTYIIVF